MDRRQFVMAGGSGLAVLGGASAIAAAANTAGGSSIDLPRRMEIRVAFLLGDNANVIDTAGPWEVFQDVQAPPLGIGVLGNWYNPFRLYSVAASADALRMSGGFMALPHFTVVDAPQPHVIVVPAQKSDDAALAWLADASANADVTMSVCTGAFQLARAGLLEDVPATTHHLFWDAFEKEFPHIELRRGPRFVDSGHIATAGGLTSGIDMALHVVRRYLGLDAAVQTASYMEHHSTAWKDPS
jgi:transcriptional regulator GlxA family with amidase domain